MKTLTVFYDARCGVCRAAREWLGGQPARVEIRFVPHDSAEAVARFPRLFEEGGDREIVVLADDGRWWQGEAAWLTCLWATYGYREWSYRLATPALRPLVARFVKMISENRVGLSRWLHLRSDMELARELERQEGCPDGTCGVPASGVGLAMADAKQEVAR